MIIILMGVTGAGKTAVGQALAAELRWRFVDGDDYHSSASVAKMKAGTPLNDADRAPWLQALRAAIVGWRDAGENVVLACSALKDMYRRILVVGPEVRLVFLEGSYELIAQRLLQRSQHYMNPNLLRSQFDTLEEPHGVLTVDIDQSIPQIIGEIRTILAI